MMTLEQIRQRSKAENAAARRLQAAGYRLEGWDPRTDYRREHKRRAPHVLRLPHLAGCRRRSFGLNAPDTLAGLHRKAAPPHYPGSSREIIRTHTTNKGVLQHEGIPA